MERGSIAVDFALDGIEALLAAHFQSICMLSKFLFFFVAFQSDDDMVQRGTIFLFLFLLLLSLRFHLGAVLQIGGHSCQRDVRFEPVGEDENEVHFEVLYEI